MARHAREEPNEPENKKKICDFSGAGTAMQATEAYHHNLKVAIWPKNKIRYSESVLETSSDFAASR
jgi:hypothetical protein